MLTYNKYTLSNGLRVIIVPNDSKQVVTTLAMFGVGSRYEDESEAGISHILEHMFFKGTKKFPNSLLVSEYMEEIGGEYNAFTSKEYTGYYTKTASKYLENSIDFISEILVNSLFDATELDKEKGVILQELDMYEDMPMEVVGNRFERALFCNNSLGRDIIGYKNSIQATTSEGLIDYKNRFYTSNNCTIVIVGNVGAFSDSDILKLLENKFLFVPGTLPSYESVLSCDKPALSLTNKKTEQSHLVVGFPGVSFDSEDKFKLKMLSVILGGIASSRMFTEIREKRGLAYSVRSSTSNYGDTGSLETYAGVPHSKVAEVIESILFEYDRIKSDLKDGEIRKAKEVLYGRILIGFDDTNELANNFALNETMSGKILTPDELIAKYQALQLSEIVDVANRFIDKNKVVLSFIGRDLTDQDAKLLIK